MKFGFCRVVSVKAEVAPLAGAWIEISMTRRALPLPPVAPLAGAWIEIPRGGACASTPPTSPPSRGRGLKYRARHDQDLVTVSPPSRGRGLKCLRITLLTTPHRVAPLAGAWIEMFYRKAKRAARGWSPPSRGRGLK